MKDDANGHREPDAGDIGAPPGPGELGVVTTTSTGIPGELFGVHIPELQLGEADYRAGLHAAGLTPGDHYLELGSGHGRGLVMAAAEFGATATGVEYVDDAIARTNAAAATARVTVDVERGDLLLADVSRADVVHMHLGPAFHDLLASRLEALLQPDARVIAAGWRVPGWLPITGIPEVDAYDTGYVYRPADPAMHASWGDCVDAKPPSMPSGYAVLHVHADLTDLEVRVDGDARRLAQTSATRAGRGQEVLVELPDELPCTLEAWARTASGRFARRGAPLVTSH